jgi:hypothetical protein
MVSGGQGGSAVVLMRDAQRTPHKDDLEVLAQRQDRAHERVIAVITAENLELKKKI